MPEKEKKSQKELRLGVVLYGGVSLAVYMNGVATELWYLLRASRHRVDKPGAPADDPCVQRYVALLDALAEAPGGRDLRVVVDTIAGTSAGGVNGTVLAKAIVEGAEAKVLNRVWIEDADIAKLKDEPPVKAPWTWSVGFFVARAFRRVREIKGKVESIGGLSWSWVRDQAYGQLSGKAQGRTPLSGDYFTGMIAGTLADMGKEQQVSLLPDNNAFDLFLTATDLHGWPRHLPVSATFHREPLYERAHAHLSHFQIRPHEARALDDFALTFATRATAGFPGAFAPLTYAAAARGFVAWRRDDGLPTEAEFGGAMLREHELFGFSCGLARMVDGGVLDNKPFSHVATAIERKPADREVYRCVIYVEPDPQAGNEAPPEQEPDLRGLPGGLYRLFRHEPVVEDLRRLYERNEKVAWIECIRSAGEEAAGAAARRAGEADTNARPPLVWPPDAQRLDDWRQAVNRYAAAEPFSGYGGYVALKMRRAVADLAQQLCRAYRFPYASRQAYFVRQLVRVWFDRPLAGEADEEEPRRLLDPPCFRSDGDEDGPQFHVSDEQKRLLSAFDLGFRLRRLRYLVREANGLYADDRGRRESLDRFKAALAEAVHRMNEALDSTRTTLEAVTAGTGLDAAGIEREIGELGFEPETAVGRHREALARVEALLSERMGEIGEEFNKAVIKAIEGLGEGEPQDKLVEAFVTFPFLDVMLFPLMDSAGIEDPVEVRVMRISPNDGDLFKDLSGGRPPLASAPLGAFAGFLNREAREHDLLWGRLDGAERLVGLLLTASGVESNSGLEDRRRRLLEQILIDSGKPEHLQPLLGRLRAALT